MRDAQSRGQMPLVLAFLVGAIVGQFLLFVYVWWLLERAS